jgi:hypothetical protein
LTNLTKAGFVFMIRHPLALANGNEEIKFIAVPFMGRIMAKRSKALAE